MSQGKPDTHQLQLIVDIVIRLAAVVLVLVWAFQILKPFILPVVWAVIMAVAVYPAYDLLQQRLGARRRLAAFLLCAFALLIIIVPSFLLAESLYQGVASVRENWQSGSLDIPPPTEQVRSWPLVGETCYDFWSAASSNLGEALRPHTRQISKVSGSLLSAAAGGGVALLQFIFAIIIAGILLSASSAGRKAASSFSKRLGAERGVELLKDAETTVRNVARGILGVALIQAILAGIGFFAAGIPGAGLWAVLALILGIIQIGVGPVMFFAALYLFSTASTTTAVLFLVWTLIVTPLDNLLKPVLLGKGAPVPTLVIFLGSLGGFINSGIIGLFVGAVVLSVAYKLTIVWLSAPDLSEQPQKQ